MKTQALMTKHYLPQVISSWFRLMAKTLWRKLAAKGKVFQPFPNEAPH